ncbi:hypothetical protein B0H14DRAFT_2849041 [Mycena olivaceomarginata]|nr:hypothetical protein B0H14DRAFT_2849041 [Mycena olivaceomarginata]
MSGAISAFLERNRCKPRRFTQWRRDDACSAAESIILTSSSNTSSTPAESSASAQESTSSFPSSSIPSIPAESFFLLRRDFYTESCAFQYISQLSGAFTTPTNISVSQSDSASASASAVKVPIYGGVNVPLTDASSSAVSPTNPIASGSGSLAGGIYPSAARPAATSSAEFTTFSLPLFPPGFPTPAKHSVVSLSTDASSADASSAPRLSLPAEASPESSPTIADSSGSVVPTAASASIPLTFSPTVTFGGSTVFRGGSTALPASHVPSFVPGFPEDSTAAALATSKSLSRTTCLGVLIALLLGALFAWAWSASQSQKPRLLGISPPLLQGDDGLNDAYSPVARRRARGRPADLSPPLSSASADRPLSTAETEPNVATYDVNNDHYDTDTWAIPTPPLTGPTASNSPFADPLSPRILRVIGTFPPSVPRLYVASSTRPSIDGFAAGSMSHAPALVSRPVPRTAPPVPSNYSLPWIHRTRVTTPVEAEMAQTGWNPPATWAI